MTLIQHWHRFQWNRRRARRLREFDREAEAYFAGQSRGEFPMGEPTLVADHYARKKFRAVAGGAPVFVKLYRGKAVAEARRNVALHETFSQSRIHVPRLIHADLGEETLQRYNLGCIVLEWVEGKPVASGDARGAAAALENLALFHGIAASIADSAVPRWDEPAAEDAAREIVEALRLTLDPFGAEEERFAWDVARRGAKPLLSEAPPPVLLHMDYTPLNLIRRPNGEIVTLDFEDARLGCFAFDLGAALLHFAFGYASDELAAQRPDALFASPRMEPLLQSYFAAGPSGAEGFWRAQGRAALEWSYFSMIGNLAKKSFNPFRYSRAERRRYLAQARRCWKRLRGEIR
ncbi:MAG: aminoglycoside phosphotransferase family protein [Candidatus Sumerlaeota bacterium]|nr:aminoglycoside phosphotransferase family protein [Candidatus Sumerlaeota bacterium]